MRTIPFSEARAQLADVLRGVEAGDSPMVISRRGQASGVLMSFAQYQQLSGEGQGFGDRLDGWRAKYLALDLPGGDTTPVDADPFDGVRQPDDARDFAW